VRTVARKRGGERGSTEAPRSGKGTRGGEGARGEVGEGPDAVWAMAAGGRGRRLCIERNTGEAGRPLLQSRAAAI
jgi:hypothetical protein